MCPFNFPTWPSAVHTVYPWVHTVTFVIRLWKPQSTNNLLVTIIWNKLSDLNASCTFWGWHQPLPGVRAHSPLCYRGWLLLGRLSGHTVHPCSQAPALPLAQPGCVPACVSSPPASECHAHCSLHPAGLKQEPHSHIIFWALGCFKVFSAHFSSFCAHTTVWLRKIRVP